MNETDIKKLNADIKALNEIDEMIQKMYKDLGLKTRELEQIPML